VSVEKLGGLRVDQKVAEKDNWLAFVMEHAKVDLSVKKMVDEKVW